MWPAQYKTGRLGHTKVLMPLIFRTCTLGQLRLPARLFHCLGRFPDLPESLIRECKRAHILCVFRLVTADETATVEATGCGLHRSISGIWGRNRSTKILAPRQMPSGNAPDNPFPERAAGSQSDTDIRS